jgi:acyl-CoA dehydrogenase
VIGASTRPSGWLKYAVGGTQYGACADGIDTRSICLIRETLARHSGLADFVFAMQGLGSGAITLFGTPEQKAKYLPRVVQGDTIAAFALSEADAGSDVAAMQCDARRDGDGYLLNGEKTWISNGGIADFYVVFARTGEAEGSAASPPSSWTRPLPDSQLANESKSSLRIH